MATRKPTQTARNKSTSSRAEKQVDRKSYTGHELLRCDINPDVRPFTWPRRKRKKRKLVLQPSLLPDEED